MENLTGGTPPVRYLPCVVPCKLYFAEYYTANKEPDSEWVIIPRANISAYLGSASYVDNYEKKIPEGFMEKKPEMGGVSSVRIKL